MKRWRASAPAAVLQVREADAAIVTEPTELRLCLAHKGFAWLEVETRGVAAHGSRPDLGVDAVAHMGRILTGSWTWTGDCAGARSSAAGHGIDARLADRGRAGVEHVSGAVRCEGGASHHPW